LIDINTPGVTVRPFLTIGGTPAFCETFFENVRVPALNLVGPRNGGWTIAKALLGHERTLIAAVGLSSRMLLRIKRIAAATRVGGKALLDDPVWQRRIAQHEIRLRTLEMSNYRAIASAQLGKAPGPESSILKLRGSEVLQQGYELAMELMGMNSLSWFNEEAVVPPLEQWVASSFNYRRATTIYGGTNEIQKNIIAKQILGLG
jgi:alkylation response protein AidB-like acyl-CoA dehydrogenase